MNKVENRRKILRIGHDNLLQWLSSLFSLTPYSYRLAFSEDGVGLPKDAKFLRVKYDLASDSFEIMVESETFEPVAYCMRYPELWNVLIIREKI